MTAHHTLQLASGPMHVGVTESKDDVHLSITGAHPMEFEHDKVLRFLAPLVARCVDGRRTFSVSGRGCDAVGHVAEVPGLGVVVWATPAGEGGSQ